MLDQAMEPLRRLIGILIAIFNIAYTLAYYAYATIIYGAGAILLLLLWCAFCTLSQSAAEHVQIKRWLDHRLHEAFLQEVKNMGYQELNMRARLINVGEDIKMRNEANNSMLKETCDAENFIMRKVKYYEPEFSTGRDDSFATQLDQNRQRLRVLDQEHESLKLELSQALERKRQVRHRPTLPNYRQMYRNFDAALEAMRTLRHDLPLHQCTPVSTCAQGAAPSYPEWLVPPKRLRWWEWGVLAPGQTTPQVTSLPDAGDWSTHTPVPAAKSASPAAAAAAVSFRLTTSS
ncbi:hypothetical protein UCDDA912_g00838 [Diaporthe ampelina]|uniref:Uncharacterized protein n=1 Tax=Diaporthe ampelina TaxID=1214573 RepID=A0A0G2FYA7_9PEZI|nr:hypothetical protein UCDDA912_g00838 [Diaporthe ampelina]